MNSPSLPPSIRRRLASLVYETLLLFGIVFFAGYLFGTLTQQRNGLTHRHLLAVWLAFVVGVYFVWCWTHGGQTLPMKTWRLRLVGPSGETVGPVRAVARYGLGWLWFVPPLALHPVFGLPLPATLAATAAWFLLWAAGSILTASSLMTAWRAHVSSNSRPTRRAPRRRARPKRRARRPRNKNFP